jgi:hypothetical protein
MTHHAPRERATIAALFVQRNGAYWNLPNVDPWDEQRDARNYFGPHPVVAHPPCSAWCRMAPINEKRYGHKVGEDGGCFAAALSAVRTWYGVLEHPARSLAWLRYGLEVPPSRGWQRAWEGGWVCEVSQAAYGHRAQKLTWLYAFLPAAPPELDWSRPEAEAWVSYCQNNNRGRAKPRLTKKQAKATPPAFRDILISIAASASPPREVVG